jgi:hypothetical protein
MSVTLRLMGKRTGSLLLKRSVMLTYNGILMIITIGILQWMQSSVEMLLY